MPKPLGSRPVRFAVVGAGIGRLHAEGLTRLPGTAELAAVCTRGPGAADLVGSLGRGYATSRFDDLLADPAIDVLDLCVPPDQHLPLALAAARAGKHLFIEKPLARTLEEADLILGAVRDHGVSLMTGHNQRFLGHHRHAKALIDAGALGQPYLAVAAVHVHGHIDGFRKFLSQAGGGTLIDSGVHKFDLLRWLLGDIESVNAHTGRFLQTQMEGEDCAVVSLKFRSGALGTFSCSWSAKGPREESLRIFGPRGSLVTEDHGGSLKLYTEDPPPGFEDVRELISSDGQTESIRLALGAFSEALQNGTPVPVTGADGRASLALALACTESSRSALRVEMDGSSMRRKF